MEQRATRDFLVAGAVAAIVVGTGLPVRNVPGAVAPLRGKIAFVRYSVRTGHPRIYVVTLGRGVPKQLRLPGIATEAPAWAPTGRSIAFVAGKNAPASRDITGSAHLYTAHADGSHARRLTRTPSPVGGAAWSPDGTRLVFVRTSASGSGSSLWMVGLNSGQPRRVTQRQVDLEPSWAPDGRTIAFLRIDPATYQSGIWLMRADGSGLHRILAGHKGITEPVWAPVGRRLLVRDSAAIYSLRPDGSDRRTITRLAMDANGAREDPQPAWSPNGRWIVFCQMRRGSVGGSDIWIVGADGKGLHRVARSPEADTDPSWGP